MSPKLKVKHIELAERRVDFLHPFRFGDVTVMSAPQAFVHVDIEVDGRRSSGASAELMVPKWFDKNPALGIDETIAELRSSLVIARGLYLEDRAPESAFGIHAAIYRRQVEACAKAGMPALPSLFGPAEIDKAIVDALLRALGLDLFEGLKRNIVGLDTRLAPDLAPSDLQAFFDSRSVSATIHLRHTVGMVDPVDSLREVAADHGARYFKIKLCGDPDRDIARLESLAAVLDTMALDYRATLDANEQYAEQAKLLDLVSRLGAAGRLSQFTERLLYIEQPMPRELTWQAPLGAAGQRFAFIIDEADDDYDAFPRAVRLGYRGISSKSCKGLYKSLLNGARAQALAAQHQTFITAEDLTCQAGLAVQQDTALAAYIGCTHIERNGHHYVDGFAETPDREADAFLTAHPDLYAKREGRVRLKIEGGALSLGSLRVPGFASAVAPENVGATATKPIDA
jgi:hypothetical protein